MNSSTFLGYHQLQIFAGLKKYARNLRRLFWCSLGLTISGALLGVLFVLNNLEIIDKNSPFMLAAAGGTLVFAIAYLWIKADCLDFELELSITKWLNIACLLDFAAVMSRLGIRWFGGEAIVKPISSVLGTLGLLMFIYFLRELAKYTHEPKLVKKATTILFGYSIGIATLLIMLIGVKAKLFLGPFTLMGFGVAWITSFVVAFFHQQVLLWQLPKALRELADNVFQHQETEDDAYADSDLDDD